MNELQKLILEQHRDKNCYRINPRIENETLIRPHLFRFPNFVGDNPRKKAYSVLLHLGWKIEDIHEALQITLQEIENGDFDFAVTYRPENYQRFYVDIPKETPRHKAVLVLWGLKWFTKDIAKATTYSNRQIERITKSLR